VFLFDVRQATRYQMWGKDSNLGQKTFAAQNPPNGAFIDYYLKTDVNGPIVITIADKSGKTIRTLRSMNNRTGVNRAVWDLRYDPPIPAVGGGPGGGGPGGGGGFGRGGGRAAQAAGQGGAAPPAAPGAAGPPAQAAAGAGGEQPAGEEFGGGRFGFGGGPSVVPGEYTITLRAGGKQLSKPVRIGLDPRVKVSDADLNAQLDAALKLRDLSSTLNSVVARVDDLTRQLTTLNETMRRAPDAAAAAGRAGDGDGNGASARTGQSDSATGEINAALDELKKLRATLVREAPFGYRYPPRLREEVNSLMGSISSPIAPPTEPQLLRMREVTDETQKAVSDLNAIISGSIRRINEKLSSQPHVVTGSPVK
jgi:hypothetical protein